MGRLGGASVRLSLFAFVAVRVWWTPATGEEAAGDARLLAMWSIAVLARGLWEESRPFIVVVRILWSSLTEAAISTQHLATEWWSFLVRGGFAAA